MSEKELNQEITEITDAAAALLAQLAHPKQLHSLYSTLSRRTNLSDHQHTQLLLLTEALALRGSDV